MLGKEAELHNREVSQELFEIIKLCWKDEPFAFNGKYYRVPNPPEGIKWPAADAARRYGAPGEIDEQGWLRKVSPVPKPFQKPHPLLLQAMTLTRETIGWTAGRGGHCPDDLLALSRRRDSRGGLLPARSTESGTGTEVGPKCRTRSHRCYRQHQRRGPRYRAPRVYLLGLYHSHFYPNIPTTIEPVIEAVGAACYGPRTTCDANSLSCRKS